MRRLPIVCVLLSASALGFVSNRDVLSAIQPVRYARFQVGSKIAYGIVENDRIREIRGDLFGQWQPTETVHNLSSVRLLVPTSPSKVLALAGNYRSHLDDKPAPPNPELFFKSPSCLIAHGENVVIPKGATDVHFEAELVIVIGKRARRVPVESALDYVFGITCGNDISERVWQAGDVQWARAKASDTFGPCGPFIVSGLNYGDLAIQLRQNGQTRQKDRTNNLIHGLAQIVHWASTHMTLEPGDLIFTGTAGTTSAIRPGDVLEVELEGVGVLRNGVVAE